MGKKLKSLEAGLRFGKLTTTGVYKYFKEGNKNRGKDECICDCGNITYVKREYLLKGRTVSCGCFIKEKISKLFFKHGDCNTRFYKIRASMLNRCYNLKQSGYSNYGGRGIVVCDEWHNYENFKKDMFDKYNNFVKIHGEKNTTIDRIDNNKGYYKDNCKWATVKEQANNRKTNKEVEYRGRKYKSISLMCDDLGLSNKYHLIVNRIYSGRSVERAISEEKHLSKRDS